MTEFENNARPRRWSWKQFWFALALFPIGGACWFLGMAIALGVGSSASTQDNWVYPFAELAFLAGPWIVVAGGVWFVWQIVLGPLPIKRFSLRTLLIAMTLIAMGLAVYVASN